MLLALLTTASGVPFATIEPPSPPAFRTKIDDVIRTFYDVQMMLDHHDRVALSDQLLQKIDQLAHVFKMQTRRRFVQNVEGLAGVAFGKLA